MEYSEKYLEIKSYYDNGLWSLDQLKFAVFNGWITDDEFEEITDEEYEAPTASLPTLLPSVSIADNGKVAKIVDGKWVMLVYVTDTIPYTFRKSGGSLDIDKIKDVNEIVGGTVAWNQLADLNVNNWEKSRESITFDGNKMILRPTTDGSTQKSAYVNIQPNHKYLSTGKLLADGSNVGFYFGIYRGAPNGATNFVTRIQCVFSDEDIDLTNMWDSQATGVTFGFNHASTTTTASVSVVENLQLFDLTQMFGSTIADYLYNLEQATPGAGVAWFKNLFPNNYYEYNPGELLSVKAGASKMVGFNAYNQTTGTAHVVGGEVYQITGAYTQMTIDGEEVVAGGGGIFTMPKTGTMTITGGGADTCLHLVRDGSRNGEYEAYNENVYPLDDSLELRGLFKLDANNELYSDGDVYESGGSVTRDYGIVDLGTLNWNYNSTQAVFHVTFTNVSSVALAQVASIICDKYITTSYSSLGDKCIAWGNAFSRGLHVKDSAYITAESFKTAMSGVYLVYKKATPTTETADPYQNTQIVDDFGTEEFVDYAVEAGDRDVAIPVGHNTVYTVY